MRALLDLMRENEAAVQQNLSQCKHFLKQASLKLKILDPELGQQELVKSLAAEMANVDASIARNSERQ